MKNVDKQQIEVAIDKLVEWFPEEAENLNTNRELIVNNILNDIPEPPASLSEIKHTVPKEEIELTLPHLTPCEKAIGMVVFDIVMFVFGLVGLHVSNQERLNRALIREIGPTTLRGFARSIHNFSAAEGKMAKAKALFSIMGEIWNAGGFRAAFKVVKDEMSWWEWAKTGIIATVQITAWFATDGIAFIAEAALSIMSAEQLIEDSIKVGKVC